MAHLWLLAADSSWSLLPLSGAAVALAALPGGPPPAAAPDSPRPPARLMALSPAADSPWVLVAPPGRDVRVNGLPLSTGIRLLADRDEVRAGGCWFFFSSEVLASVLPLPAAPEPVVCPRCGREIPAASPAVQCPQCRVWYHQDEASPCWTYADTCMFCPQLTDLSAGFRWTPHALCAA